MKNVVITGSTRGIGLAMAKRFLMSGCYVTVSGRNTVISDFTKSELVGYDEKYTYIACNVSIMSEVESLWKRSVVKWGTIDIWINNAGQNSPYQNIYEVETSCVDAIIDTNINGMIYGSQVASRMMLLQGEGQIWNMEGLGSNNMIQLKTVLYGMTKHALTYFTKGLAKELKGTPIKVGRLYPGMMLTDFITKTPDGEMSPVLKDKSFIFIFNILADKPEKVGAFFVPKMLENKKNNAHLVWLTNRKVMWRFMASLFVKRKLL